MTHCTGGKGYIAATCRYSLCKIGQICHRHERAAKTSQQPGYGEGDRLGSVYAYAYRPCRIWVFTHSAYAQTQTCFVQQEGYDRNDHVGNICKHIVTQKHASENWYILYAGDADLGQCAALQRGCGRAVACEHVYQKTRKSSSNEVYGYTNENYIYLQLQ